MRIIKSLSLILLVMVGMTASAQTFEVDGIYYEILSEDEMTVTITDYDDDSYGKSIAIPDRVAYVGRVYSVTSISSCAFMEARISSVQIPNTVTFIGESAFIGCQQLTSVTIPGSVLRIGKGAFGRCSNLKEIIVDESNASYASNGGILYDKDMTTLICCPGGMASATNIPSSVTSIDEEAFAHCINLSSVNIPHSVKSLPLRAFFNCSSLAYINIDSVTDIRSQVFSNCTKLSSISMNSVSTIGDEVFYSCISLESISIPRTITKIGDYAFYDCPSIKSVYCHKEEPLICEPHFTEETLFYATLYVPTGTKNAYAETYPWSEFLNIEEKDYSGIADTPQLGLSVKVIDGVISVEGSNGTAPAPLVEVYSTGGDCVYRGTESSIGGLPHGVYVVKVGDVTQKVAL